MKAVILAARKKESLYPFTESKPTGLLPVAGKPIVKHLIESLQEVGAEDIYIVTNHLEEQFEDEFGEFTNVNTVHQENLEGTGNALSQCDFLDEDFFVVNGDVLISTEDLESLKEKHQEKRPQASILASDESKPEKFGVLSITNDRVEQLVEKPEDADNTLVNTGIYIFDPGIFDVLESSGCEDLTEAVGKLVEEDVRMEIVSDYWYDIGSLRKLWKADQVKREERVEETEVYDSAEVSEDARIEGNALVGKNAKVKPGTVIEGKVVICKNSVIGPGTVLKDCTVDRDCQVRNATVEDSFIFEENVIDPEIFVERSIVGEDCDIKSGTVIRESYLGPRSYIDMNNSMKGVKTVPDARTDLGEISK